MQKIKTKSDVEARFVKYIAENSNSPDSGTPSTYHRALDVLSLALQKANTPFSRNPIVWQETDADALMDLYLYVAQEQRRYANSGSGLFASLDGSGIGKGYYRNRWCSAGVKKFAEFRAAEQLRARMDENFSSGMDGKSLSVTSQCLKLGHEKCFLPDDIDPRSKEGRERIAEVKTRIGQDVFRKWVLGIYGGQCCVTGLDVPDVLRASHIVAWADDKTNRLNPANGLCLSATYDAAFDRHLISFDSDYRLVISKEIREYCTREVCKRYFLNFEGTKMVLPSKFLPDKELLQRHFDKLIK